jgi:hypothetical protein
MKVPELLNAQQSNSSEQTDGNPPARDCPTLTAFVPSPICGMKWPWGKAGKRLGNMDYLLFEGELDSARVLPYEFMLYEFERTEPLCAASWRNG